MAIDPRLYEKYSGRKGDPMTRMGEALAKDSKARSERDELPKGVSGGLKTTMLPGFIAQFYYWLKDRGRTKD